MNPYKTLRIDEERFEKCFKEASEIGATEGLGLDRPTFSDHHLEVRKWFASEVEKSGLEFHIDKAGNHSGVLRCDNGEAKTFIIGSHLDSVPNGGRFDGNLGVISALEVALTIKDHKIDLPFHLEVMDFTDEEGTHIPLLGSRAICGKLTSQEVISTFMGTDLLHKADLDSATVLHAKRNPDSLAGYMEVHIEQGTRLESTNTDIGIVSSITGIGRHYITFIGSANHAGTTPMNQRKDASLGASAFVLACNTILIREYPDCVVNTGNIDFSPAAFNVIPNSCRVWLEYRAPESSIMTSLGKRLLDEAQKIAELYNLELSLEEIEMVESVPMTDDIQEAFAKACEVLNLSHKPLTSGAGHDAQSFGGLSPTGMIFIPSVGGYSHSDKEFSNWGDCVNGANALLHAVLDRAKHHQS